MVVQVDREGRKACMTATCATPVPVIAARLRAAAGPAQAP